MALRFMPILDKNYLLLTRILSNNKKTNINYKYANHDLYF